MCDTYYYLTHTTFRFGLIDFQLNIDFTSQFYIFYRKSYNVTQRSVSKENAFKKSKNLSPFLRKTIGSNKSFTLIENNFRFFKIAKFEFKVTVHYSLWAKCTQLWPQNMSLICVRIGAPKMIRMAKFWSFCSLLKFEWPQLLQTIMPQSKCCIIHCDQWTSRKERFNSS